MCTFSKCALIEKEGIEDHQDDNDKDILEEHVNKDNNDDDDNHSEVDSFSVGFQKCTDLVHFQIVH